MMATPLAPAPQPSVQRPDAAAEGSRRDPGRIVRTPGRMVLHVVNDPGVFLSHRRSFARAAQRHGWDVHVATPDGPDVRMILDEGFAHHGIAMSRRGMNPIEEARTLVGLTRLFRRLAPAVVDCATIKPVLYGGMAAWRANVPAVVHTITGLGHVFASRRRGAGLRRGLVRAAYIAAFRHPNTKVLFQNGDDLERLQFALRPGQGALIAGSGVDPDRFRACAEPHGTPIVLFAGRLLWTKGVAEFVEAARRLRARGVRARFVLVGRPDENNPAAVPSSSVQQWVAAGDVEYWGQRQDMPDVLRQACIVCLPTYYGEGVPKILVEAAAVERAIVTTDWPGCREIVRDGWNGLLAPPRAPAPLADAIGALLADPARRRLMGARGREVVLTRYTEAHVTGAVLRLYEELSRLQVDRWRTRTA